MIENIYMLADCEIYRRIGAKIRSLRLRQNFSQMSLAEQAQISLSSVKRIEEGEIRSFDSLLRVLRVLGALDIFSSMMEEDEMSPNEYYEFVHSLKKKQRKRATPQKLPTPNKEQSTW